MPRSFTIAGIGETLLVESPAGPEADGLAAVVALLAIRLGHRGVCISRIGQDEAGSVLHGLLTERGVDVTAMQQDPDLPTGRVIVRAAGPPIARHLEAPAAFDNLQADFDLEDLALRVDAVVYGLLSRRSSQTRFEEEKFLAHAAAAFKVFDLTNRGDDDVDRSRALGGLAVADAAIFDAASLTRVRPDLAGDPPEERVRRLLREAGMQFGVFIERDERQQRVTVVTPEATQRDTIPPVRRAHVAFVVGLLDGVLQGDRPEVGAGPAARVAAHAVEHPDEEVPQEWRGAG
ncbi:MAG: hypothetical protein HKO59_10280 [Phycisphaerales bacterium]|nr:hypothetical protein [Phycisphaerales bacterium]NNM26351.1 hypothetical protein [Phycisphaerales bacterium]